MVDRGREASLSPTAGEKLAELYPCGRSGEGEEPKRRGDSEEPVKLWKQGSAGVRCFRVEGERKERAEGWSAQW